MVADIVNSHPSIKYVIASAPGKIEANGEKITDLLYCCYNCKKSNQDYKESFYKIQRRFDGIVRELNLKYNVTKDLEEIMQSLEIGCEEDYFVSRGEYISGKILAEYLGFDFIDAKDVIFFNDEGELDINKTEKEMKTAFRYTGKAVIPGVYGSCKGEIKTFTRGGSDITGSVVSLVAKANVYENWTDVDGFLKADPRIIKNPKKIDVLTYKELRELSYMGANVLHDEAVFPAKDGNIPINIKNTFFPKGRGTFIVDRVSEDEDSKPVDITGISGKKNYTVFNICKSNMANKVGNIKNAADVFSKRNIVIQHIPTGIDTFSIICSSSEVKGMEEEIKKDLHESCKPDKVSIYDNIALIAVVGRGMVSKTGALRRIFGALEKQGIEIIIVSLSISNLNVIIGVRNEDFETCIERIYNEFTIED